MKLKIASFKTVADVPGRGQTTQVDAERHGVEMPVRKTPGGIEYVQLGDRSYPLANLEWWTAYP